MQMTPSPDGPQRFRIIRLDVGHMVSMPSVVPAQEWESERDALLVAEKEATRHLDAIAARRRRLPMVRFENKKYLFETADGPKRLLDFFDGRPQLAIYRFMDNGPDAFERSGQAWRCAASSRGGG
jgi:predicted dithiol-disulfide oxidoreductase (DUF899 family)